jgi:hypothetical protein
MADTYVAISTVTVGGAGSATITFSSIPSTYTDLLVKLSLRGGQANVNQSTTISLNGSSSNFTGKRLYGTGSTTGSDNSLQLESNGASATASVFSNEEVYIANYNSSKAKAISVDGVLENNATLAYSILQAGLWNPVTQAAITSITFTAVSNSFVQYSTATLYGIKSS